MLSHGMKMVRHDMFVMSILKQSEIMAWWSSWHRDHQPYENVVWVLIVQQNLEISIYVLVRYFVTRNVLKESHSEKYYQKLISSNIAKSSQILENRIIIDISKLFLNQDLQ